MTAQQEKSLFHLGDLLTVTCGRLLSPRYMDGVYEIVRFLTGSSPGVDSLEEELARCRPFVLEQFPALSEVDASDIGFQDWRGWLHVQVQIYGEWFELERPARDDS